MDPATHILHVMCMDVFFWVRVCGGRQAAVRSQAAAIAVERQQFDALTGSIRDLQILRQRLGQQLVRGPHPVTLSGFRAHVVGCAFYTVVRGPCAGR